MRFEKQRGPFKTIEIYFENLSPSEIKVLRRRYVRVSLMLHKELPGMEGFRLRQKQTPNIYLNDGIETVFTRFRDTVRNEIHRTERLSGFEIRLPDTPNEQTYALYSAFEFAQFRVPIPREEFELYSCACAYLNGELISGITFFQSTNIIRIRSIFSSRLNAKKQEDKDLYKIVGFASKRLIFEICKYGTQQGVLLVDLASINLTDPNKEQIARFKSGFGARIEYEYQYIATANFFKVIERMVGLLTRLRAHIGL